MVSSHSSSMPALFTSSGLVLARVEELSFQDVDSFRTSCRDLIAEIDARRVDMENTEDALTKQIKEFCDGLLANVQGASSELLSVRAHVQLTLVKGRDYSLVFRVMFMDEPVMQVVAQVSGSGKPVQLSEQTFQMRRPPQSAGSDEELLDWPLERYSPANLMAAMSLCHAVSAQLSQPSSAIKQMVDACQKHDDAKAQWAELVSSYAKKAATALRNALHCIDPAALKDFWQQPAGTVADLLYIGAWQKNQITQEPCIVLVCSRYQLEIAGEKEGRYIRSFVAEGASKTPYDHTLEKALKEVNSALRLGVEPTPDSMGVLRYCVPVAQCSDDVSNYLKRCPSLVVSLRQ